MATLSSISSGMRSGSSSPHIMNWMQADVLEVQEQQRITLEAAIRSLKVLEARQAVMQKQSGALPGTAH